MTLPSLGDLPLWVVGLFTLFALVSFLDELWSAHRDTRRRR
jgi:hypothetical protein